MSAFCLCPDKDGGETLRRTVVRRKGDALDESRVCVVDVDVAEVFEAMEHGASHDCVFCVLNAFVYDG